MRLVIAAVVLCPLLAAPAAAQWPPEKFENLQVLSDSIPLRDLVDLMAGFTRALGVRCTYCHVGEEGRPLGTYDFPSDDKPTKRKAREMLEMVTAINARYLPRLEEREDPPVAVQCVTCHGGITTPRTLQDVLLLADRAGGLDSLLATYRALREQYHGRAAYDFGEVPLADVAGTLRGDGRLADAVRLYGLNVEQNPAARFPKLQYAQAAVELAFVDGGPPAGVARYRELQTQHGAGVFPEPSLNQLGYALLGRGKTAEAIEVFTLTVNAFPRSANAHDSLGEAYAAAGDVARAIASYERSLALDPQNTNAQEKLQALRTRQ